MWTMDVVVKNEVLDSGSGDSCEATATPDSCSREREHADEGGSGGKRKRYKEMEGTSSHRYICPSCPALGNMTFDRFLRHIKFHQERPYKCVECCWHLPKGEEGVERHWNEYHRGCQTSPKVVEVAASAGSVWKCHLCKSHKISFETLAEREKHRRKYHAPSLKTPSKFSCQRCPEIGTQFLHEWRLHRALEHADENEFCCFYCEEEFRIKINEDLDIVDRKALNEHLKEVHPLLKPKLLFEVCVHCGEVFSQHFADKNLAAHMKDKHNVTQKMEISCPICQDAFTRREHLVNHLLRHSERRIMCEICGWKGVIEFDLTQHKFHKHKIVSEEKMMFRCSSEGCRFQCVLKSTLDRHEATKHDNERCPPSFLCNVCGKSYKSKGSLKTHGKLHSKAQHTVQ